MGTFDRGCNRKRLVQDFVSDIGFLRGAWANIGKVAVSFALLSLSVTGAGNLTHVRHGVEVGLLVGIGGGPSFRSLDLGPLDAVVQELPVLEKELVVVSALVNSLGQAGESVCGVCDKRKYVRKIVHELYIKLYRLKRLTQIELPQEAGVLHLAKVHGQNVGLEQIDVLHLERPSVGLEANDLAEHLAVGDSRQLPVLTGIGARCIIEHYVQLEREEGGSASTVDVRGCFFAVGRLRGGFRWGGLAVVVVIVRHELANISVGRDLAGKFDL